MIRELFHSGVRRIVALLFVLLFDCPSPVFAQFQPHPKTRVRAANPAGAANSNQSFPPRPYVVVPVPGGVATDSSRELSDDGIVLTPFFRDMNRQGWAVNLSGSTVLDFVNNRSMNLNAPSSAQLQTIIPAGWYADDGYTPPLALELHAITVTSFHGERISDNGKVVGFTEFEVDFIGQDEDGEDFHVLRSGRIQTWWEGSAASAWSSGATAYMMSLMPPALTGPYYENEQMQEAPYVVRFDCTTNSGQSVALGGWLYGVPTDDSKILFPSLTGAADVFPDFSVIFPVTANNRNQFAGMGGILDHGTFYSFEGSDGYTALGINDHSQAVGNNFHPVSLFQKFTPPSGPPWWDDFDINELTEENSPWVIQVVHDINNDGVILALGRYTDPNNPESTQDSAVLLIPLEILPDDGLAGVIGDMVPSNQGVTGQKHFVSPQKTPEIPDEYVTLKARGVSPALFARLFEWGADGEPVPNEPLKRRVKRDATGKAVITVEMKSTGQEVAKLNVWVVWATASLAHKGEAMFDHDAAGAIYFVIDSPDHCWRFLFDIEPKGLFTTSADIPALFELREKDVPGKGIKHSVRTDQDGDSATYKWDVSRQLRITIRNGTGLSRQTLSQPGQPFAWYVNQPKLVDIPIRFPINDAEGNDDTIDISDEDDDPYIPNSSPGFAHGLGQLSSVDVPLLPVLNLWGGPLTSYAAEADFREFARVELWDGKRQGGRFWFRVSERFLWHHYLRPSWDTTLQRWNDLNSSAEIGNQP